MLSRALRAHALMELLKSTPVCRRTRQQIFRESGAVSSALPLLVPPRTPEVQDEGGQAVAARHPAAARPAPRPAGTLQEGLAGRGAAGVARGLHEREPATGNASSGAGQGPGPA